MKIGILLLLLCAAVVDVSAQSVKRGSAKTKPAIEFGHRGGNLRPFAIAIFKDGRVEIIEGEPTLKTSSISPAEVKELIAKASNKLFWRGSHIEKRPRLPDFGFVFVRVRKSSGKVIHREGAQSGRLGDLYLQLSELVLGNS